MSYEYTKTEKTVALNTIINEARNSKLTRVGLKRVQWAGKALGLNEEEAMAIEYALEYRDYNGKLIFDKGVSK